MATRFCSLVAAAADHIHRVIRGFARSVAPGFLEQNISDRRALAIFLSAVAGYSILRSQSIPAADAQAKAVLFVPLAIMMAAIHCGFLLAEEAWRAARASGLIALNEASSRRAPQYVMRRASNRAIRAINDKENI